MKNSSVKTSWDLRPLFSSDDDPLMEEERKKIEEVSTRFINRWKDRSDYLEKPNVLRVALDEYEAWERNFGVAGKQGYYWTLRYSQNQNDPKIKAKINQTTDFANRILNEIQFFELRISRIDQGMHESFLKSEELQPYRHFLARLFAKAEHLLSELEEKIMNLKSTTSWENWERLTMGLVSKEERVVGRQKKNFSEIYNLLSESDKKLRDSAADAFNDIILRWLDVGEAEFNSLLFDKKINDELRKFKSPEEGRHVADDIETEVVDSLISAVSKKFEISRKYYELKAKLFGVTKLAYHERAVPFGEFHDRYSYEESVALVSRVFKRLDGRFGQIFEEYVEKGQVDVFPAKGKRSGAFCVADLLTTPVFVLLNHDDKLKSVLTIAHEFGHAINDHLIKEKQNALNAHTTLSTAEVASTFMEDFVFEELLKKADLEKKLILSMMKMDELVNTIFRQAAAYQFEQEMHDQFRKKGYLSKEEIGRIFQKHMKDYMGDFVEQSPGSQNWWVQWPHFRTPFYVYSYVSGLLISKSLQVSFRRDSDFITKVKEFLSAGSSDSPKNIFSRMGVDLTDVRFWDEGLEDIERFLDETERLAKSLGKM